MKNRNSVTVAGVLLVLLPALGLSGDLASLRGGNKLDSDATQFESKKQIIQSGGFERSWELQPPIIPHSIDKDKISIKGNTCLSCHSKANFEKKKAPEIGESHYQDRDGNVLGEISSRRWFCSQCPVCQPDPIQPLNGIT